MASDLKIVSLVPLLILTILSCGRWSDRPQGLKPTPEGNGPRVVIDLEARPFPEVPFPNNLATVPDPGSPTGLRVNVSLIASTELETGIREKLDRLSGFGVASPVSVRFSARLDLRDIARRHQPDLDFSDDAIFLINLNPASLYYGEAVPLDLGQGNFPFVLERPDNYFGNDPRAGGNNLLFETVEEDSNGNGLLDPGEDTDFDGVLDHPNTWPEGVTDPDNYLITFYELETETLIARPLRPLEEESLYAVVLTTRLQGTDGQPVRSPYPEINHPSQTRDLQPLPGLISRYGLSLDDVAFAWTFTTQSVTRDLVAIRKGLYGVGPFAYLARDYPARVDAVLPMNDDPAYPAGGQYRTEAQVLIAALKPALDALPELVDPASINALIATYDYVDYFVNGSYTTPYFLADKDGIATEKYLADEDESFDLDPLTGEAFLAPATVYFMCSVPKPGPGRQPPFPVVVEGHGYTSSRFEMLGFAGSLARHGLAVCAIDAVGHGTSGLNITPGTNLASKVSLFEIIKSYLGPYHLGPFVDALLHDRARDLNNDGRPESGGDFWTADTFHTRDIVRQSIVDYFQLIRLLRSFDGNNRWDLDLNQDGEKELAGDFNFDGVPDLGGPTVDYHTWGISLGGILSGLLAGVEPAITAAAPTSGAGGLTNVAIRCTQPGVVEAVFLRMLGPILVGNPQGNGLTRLKFLLPDVNVLGEVPLADTTLIQPGDRVILSNLKTGEQTYAVVNAQGYFRAQLPADAMNAVEKRAFLGINDSPVTVTDPFPLGDGLEIRVVGPDGKEKGIINQFGLDAVWQGAIFPAGVPLVFLAEGMGKLRQTPDLRRFFGISQTILDPADPNSYAPHYFQDPLDFRDTDPGIQPGANVLVIPTVGDMNVPVNTGVQIARSAGIIDLFQIDTRYGKTPNQVLIDKHVLEGTERLNRYTVPVRDGQGQTHSVSLLFDVDDLDGSRGYSNCACVFTDSSLRDWRCSDPNGNLCGDAWGEPTLDPPLRLSVKTPSGVAGMRIPYMNPHGQHGFDVPHPEKAFNIDTYLLNLIGHYFATKGTEIVDDPCLADSSCDFFTQ